MFARDESVGRSVDEPRRRPRAAGQIIDVLRGQPFLTRAQLIDRSQLSRSSVSGAVSELLAAGLVTERTTDAGPHGRHPGRPAAAVCLTPKAGLIGAVDFGHSHLSVAVADLSLCVLAERSTEFDVVARSMDEALRFAEAELRSTLESVRESRALIAVGLGLPMPIPAGNGHARPGSILPGWDVAAAASELGDRLKLPVVVDNDANLGALAEVRLGVARDAGNVLYLKVSSGLGAGIVLSGEVYRGARGFAGELGHVPVRAAGAGARPCRCGGRACLETVASLTAVLHALQPAFGAVGLSQLLELAVTEPVAARALTEAGRAIGMVVGDLANTLNPAVVVLGGRLAAAAEPVLTGLR